jgi:hypothetical protein
LKQGSLFHLHLVHLVLLESQEIRGQLDHRDHLVSATLGHLVLKVTEDFQASQACRDSLGPKVMLV